MNHKGHKVTQRCRFKRFLRAPLWFVERSQRTDPLPVFSDVFVGLAGPRRRQMLGEPEAIYFSGRL